MVLAVGGEVGRRRIVSEKAFVDPIFRPAAKRLDLLRRQWFFGMVNASGAASHLHGLGLVATFLQMRKPIVGHELNPEGSQNIQVICFVIVAIRLGCIFHRACAVAAVIGRRLTAREELSANQLRIGFQQSQSIAVAILCDLAGAQLGEGGFEFHVARKRLAGRSHERVQNVVANSRERAEADHFAGTFLPVVAADAGK